MPDRIGISNDSSFWGRFYRVINRKEIISIVKITELRKHLKESGQDQLIKDIVDLFQKNDFVKDYYITKYNADNSLTVLIKYKETIEHEFFPVNGDGKARLSVAKKAITEFKKISKDKTSTAELMTFYVETGVQYTDCYGHTTDV
jgi:ribosomal protein S8